MCAFSTSACSARCNAIRHGIWDTRGSVVAVTQVIAICTAFSVGIHVCVFYVSVWPTRFRWRGRGQHDSPGHQRPCLQHVAHLCFPIKRKTPANMYTLFVVGFFIFVFSPFCVLLFREHSKSIGETVCFPMLAPAFSHPIRHARDMSHSPCMHTLHMLPDPAVGRPAFTQAPRG